MTRTYWSPPFHSESPSKGGKKAKVKREEKWLSNSKKKKQHGYAENEAKKRQNEEGTKAFRFPGVNPTNANGVIP
jgi:hypothetical protein